MSLLSRPTLTLPRNRGREWEGVLGYAARARWEAAALIMSAPFSAIMMTVALVLPETIVGMIDASTTRSPSSSLTRNSSSTTANGSLPILHVPMT